MIKTLRSHGLLALAVLALLAVIALPLISGCGSGSDEPAQATVARDQLVVATTTSLNDSGLFEDVVQIGRAHV